MSSDKTDYWCEAEINLAQSEMQNMNVFQLLDWGKYRNSDIFTKYPLKWLRKRLQEQ